MKIFTLPEGVERAEIAVGGKLQTFAPGVDYIAAEGVSDEWLAREGIFAVRESATEPRLVAVETAQPWAVTVTLKPLTAAEKAAQRAALEAAEKAAPEAAQQQETPGA